MAVEVVGRDEELGSLRAFLDRGPAAEGPTAFVLDGEVGIGKSTLWIAAVEAARERDLRILSARPAEAERGLAHAGLGDLFDDVLGDVAPKLTAPQRRALEVALLVSDPAADPVDPRALGVAVRNSLQLLSGDEFVVLAIDDVQWLDASSASTLAFALRRLPDAHILLLLARRVGDGAQASPVEDAVESNRIERLRVEPLSVGAIQRLLHDRLGRTFARPTLFRVHEVSGGNPFYALELARAIEAVVDPTQPLPVPERLEELVRVRLDGFTGATRDALALASAHGRLTAGQLSAAAIEEGVLEPALDEQVLEFAEDAVRFTHPLLASVLYQGLSTGERQRAHRRLVEIVEDPLGRARHLALSTERPDSEIAAMLEQAAAAASLQGAPIAAAELGEHALRLTPPDEHRERHRRALAAARAHQAAGEWMRARAIATDLLAEVEIGSVRAEALVLLAELESRDRGTALLEAALREGASSPALQSIVHCRLAWARRFRGGSEHARAALELAEELDDDVLRARARAVQAILGWFAGDAEAPDDLLARARDFPGAVGGEQLVQEATLAVVNTLAPSSTRDEARALLEREHRDWRERDEPRSARALWGLAWVEFWAGRWALAAAHAAHAYDISIQYGHEVPQDHLPIAVIAVHRGQLELAREHSERALELAGGQFPLHPPQHMAVLGLVALRSGHSSAAVDWLGEADQQCAALGWGEPSLRWWSSDYCELLLELGRIADAVRVLDDWERDAARVARDWVLAHVTRCRGLVAAAQGNVDQAAYLLQQAVAQHEDVGDPFGRARAQLALGVVRRRAGRKRAARESIEAAVDAFEQLGAVGWADKARAELGRIGGRTRTEGLTPAERRVADLVATGRTNTEVATALFLAERTVASHLTHIYAKLGLRSRTELARRLQ